MSTRIPPTTECAGCGKQIGFNDYILATDGINGRHVAFHKKCDPRDPDLQRRIVVTLSPVTFGFKPEELFKKD